MNTGKTLFAQTMDFLPWKTFHRIVARHGGNKGVRTLTCAEQFRAMAFAQLTYRESLRDVEACLQAQAAKLYHMGFREPVARSTLADANESRDWRIWESFAGRLIVQARELYLSEDLGLDLTNTVYALDSTTIDLCLSVFPWAHFRTTKAAVKMHTLLDLKGDIPSFIHISDGKLHDVHALVLKYCRHRLNIYEHLANPMVRDPVIANGDRMSKLELLAGFRNVFNGHLCNLLGGLNRFPQELRKRLDVSVSSPVIEVRQLGEGVNVVSRGANGDIETHRADTYVIATPMHVSHDICPTMRPLLAPICRQQQYSKSVVVQIGTGPALLARERRKDRRGRIQLTGDFLSTGGQNVAVIYGNRAARNLIEAFPD